MKRLIAVEGVSGVGRNIVSLWTSLIAGFEKDVVGLSGSSV